MESRVNYTAVGVFVVFLTLLLVVFGYWMTSGRHTKNYATYVLYLKESVNGLGDQAPVKFNGVIVGYVKNAQLMANDLQKVKLTLKIERGIPITIATRGTLKAQGITGVTYIGLEALTPNAPILKAQPGEKYPIIEATPSFLVQLSESVFELSKNLTSLSKNFQTIFDDENVLAFKTSLKNTKTLTEALAKSSEKITSSIDSADKMLANASKASDSLPNITKKFDKALDSVQAMSLNFTITTNDARRTIKGGQGVIDNLSTQAVPEAIQLIHRLNTMTVNLEQLSTDLKHNPSLILRGRAAEKPGPGE